MGFSLDIFNSGLIDQYAVNEISKANEYSEMFGLTLSRLEIQEIVSTRARALRSAGRIEIRGGVIEKIIKEFCDSPYISQRNYADVINELVEIFYYYKNETVDKLTDDELIRFMRESFDSSCQGSTDLLEGRELYMLAKKIRFEANNINFDEEIQEEETEDYE